MISDRPEQTDPIPFSLKLRLMGSFALEIHGSPAPSLSRAARSLLALLALRGSIAAERDSLAATLWPDSDEAAARYNLRRTLTELRAALGPEASRLVSPSSRTLRLDLSSSDSGAVYFDVAAFDAATTTRAGTAGAVEALPELAARDLELLPGERGEWILGERVARVATYLAARERLTRQQTERGEWTLALAHLRAIISVDPLRETALRDLMRLLQKTGQNAAALAEYQRLRDRLRAEADTVPDAETMALYQQLLTESQRRKSAGDQGAPTREPSASGEESGVPLRGLPRPLSTLIGRDRDAMEVTAFLRRDKDRAPARLVTLTGSGGVGKTRLALAVAEASLTDYEDGVCFVDLAPLAEPAGLLTQIAAALRMPASARRADADLLDRVIGTLRPLQILLLLDNCEHLGADVARLALTLLRDCPRLTLLATSREPLGVAGESTWRVPGLSEDAAVRLFTERAAQADFGFRLTDANLSAVRQIVIRLDAIPLAIEMAAARVRALPVAQIAARLGDVFRLLTAPGGDLLPRHRTLRATLDWSYDLLSPVEKLFLTRLSVFAGGWTLAAAEIVGVGDGIDTADVFDLLASLIDKSLVQFNVGPDDEGRYRLLETIRQYGFEKLAHSGEAGITRDRHRDWCVALAEEAKPHLAGASAPVWHARLESEHDNLRAALAWCAASAAEDGVEDRMSSASLAGLRLSASLTRFWLVRGYISEGRAHLARALAGWRASYPADVPSVTPILFGDRQAGSEDPSREWYVAVTTALTSEAMLMNAQGDSAAAWPLLQQSLSLSRAIDHREGIASSLSNLGTVAHMRGDYAGARALHSESLDLYRELGDPWAIAAALNNLGTASVQQADYAAARTFHAESLALRRRVGDQNVIANSLNSLGTVAFRLGEFADATALFEESLAIQRAIGDSRGISQVLNNLALVASDQGDYAGAEALLEESLDIKREINDQGGVASVLDNLGGVLLFRGDLEKARTFFEDSLAIRRQIADKSGISVSLSNIGETGMMRGDPAAAAVHYGESLALSREVGDRRGIAMGLLNVGNAAIANGDFPAARSHIAESLRLHRDIASNEGIANGLGRMALLSRKAGDPRRAVRLWAAAATVRTRAGLAQPPFEKSGDDRLLGEAKAELGDAAFAAAWAGGSAMTMEEAMDEAIG